MTTNDWFQIGNVGTGQFNLSGGMVSLLAECHIGDDSTGLGTGSGIASVTGGAAASPPISSRRACGASPAVAGRRRMRRRAAFSFSTTSG